MERGHLPVIMLTADARPEARSASEDAGADAFLTKPVNSRELMDAIARLAGQAARAPAATTHVTQAVELDESVLDDLVQLGGDTFVQDLLKSFEEESGRLVREVENALEAQNFAQWHDRLHMLKGGASDIGANLLAQRCTEAERIKAFELGTSLAHERLDAVRLALSEAQTALAAYQATRLRAERL
jgi:two-component system sensor histidine kinase RpfC